MKGWDCRGRLRRAAPRGGAGDRSCGGVNGAGAPTGGNSARPVLAPIRNVLRKGQGATPVPAMRGMPRKQLRLGRGRSGSDAIGTGSGGAAPAHRLRPNEVPSITDARSRLTRCRVERRRRDSPAPLRMRGREGPRFIGLHRGRCEAQRDSVRVALRRSRPPSRILPAAWPVLDDQEFACGARELSPLGAPLEASRFGVGAIQQVQLHGGADKSLERLFVHDLALANVEGPHRIAV